MDDRDLLRFNEDGKRLMCFKRITPHYKYIRVPEGITIVGGGAFRYAHVKYVLLPEGVEKIEAGAFKECRQLKKVYLPASVKTIGDETFLNCNKKLEIYCEGAPQEGWLDGEETVRKYYEDMTDAFNFHRSGGSFDDHYVVERVEITHNNYNPDKRPVHTNVPREEFERLVEAEIAKAEERKRARENK